MAELLGDSESAGGESPLYPFTGLPRLKSLASCLHGLAQVHRLSIRLRDPGLARIAQRQIFELREALRVLCEFADPPHSATFLAPLFAFHVDPVVVRDRMQQAGLRYAACVLFALCKQDDAGLERVLNGLRQQFDLIF